MGITGNGQQRRSEYILQKKVKDQLKLTNVLKFHQRLLDFIEISGMHLSHLITQQELVDEICSDYLPECGGYSGSESESESGNY